LKNRQPIFAVESKTGETDVSRHISYFASRTEIPFFFQVHQGVKDYEVSATRTRVLPFTTFAAEILKI